MLPVGDSDSENEQAVPSLKPLREGCASLMKQLASSKGQSRALPRWLQVPLP